MKIIKSLIFLIAALTIYASYLNNESSEIQAILVKDFNTSNYSAASTARFDNFNMDFPNISLTTMPIRAMVSKYYFLGAQYTKALELIDESTNSNPYIMYNESVKFEIFDALKVQDSAIFYSEKAFTGIPNNQKHFIELAKSYVSQQKHEKLDSMFRIVKRTNVPVMWQFYLSSLLTDETKISNYGKSIAKEALNKYPGNDYPQVNLAAQYVVVGTDNVNQGIKLDNEAETKYNEGNYNQAAEIWEEAAKLNYIDYTYFENAGLSHYNAMNYNRAIYNFKYVIDSLNPKTGKSEYLISLSYDSIGNKEKACEYAVKSSKHDFKRAFQLIGQYCD